MNDLLSGLFNSSYAIGGITGPIFGGYVNEFTNFRTTSDILALILIFVGTSQLLIVYIPEKIRARKIANKKSNVDHD